MVDMTCCRGRLLIFPTVANSPAMCMKVQTTQEAGLTRVRVYL